MTRDELERVLRRYPGDVLLAVADRHYEYKVPIQPRSSLYPTSGWSAATPF